MREKIVGLRANSGHTSFRQTLHCEMTKSKSSSGKSKEHVRFLNKERIGREAEIRSLESIMSSQGLQRVTENAEFETIHLESFVTPRDRRRSDKVVCWNERHEVEKFEVVAAFFATRAEFSTSESWEQRNILIPDSFFFVQISRKGLGD